MREANINDPNKEEHSPSPESIARAITLKVLADAPDSRGPFVLEIRERLGEGDMQRIQRTWNVAFNQTGRDAPSLLILSDGIVLRPATEEEARYAG